MFEPVQFSRVSKSIIEQLRQAIINESLKPGDRLPSEKDLARRFGVSKASLREAFRALEALGLLEIRQGVAGGAFVREVDMETARESLFNYIFFQDPSIRDFTQLRTILEPQIVEIAAQKATDEDLRTLEHNLRETRKNLDSGSFFYELDISFHREIASITQNTLLVFIIDAVKNALINIKRLLQPDLEFSKQVYYAHERIFEALCARDPVKAKAEMLRHIQEVELILTELSDSKDEFISGTSISEEK